MAVAVIVRPIWASASVPASGSIQSVAVDVRWFPRLRPHIVESGADITVTAEGSTDASTWFDLETYALAAVGFQPVIEAPLLFARLSAANENSLSAQTVSAELLLGKRAT